ncbi:ZIP family metal transporter [Streptomyces zagrosensis]|uniref:ZIP family zinc transporter n=1 Tax=Streptomyces zagrosensis TaxID=1042984 RepID=A0A7W9UWW4_9ACTN|nr:ZIP family metal transporter [Streptomyces zagrosensis]MBB5933676.1 ZIP family zinc transporter [Streptomyces zagrosensis]
MPVVIALGAMVMTLLGGWTAHRVTDRRHLILGLAGGLMLGVVGLDLLPEALEVAGQEVYGVPTALLCFVAGFLLAHAVERLLAERVAAHHVVRRVPEAERGTKPGATGEATTQDTASAMPGRAPQVGLTAAAAMVGHSAMDGVALGLAAQISGDMTLAVAVAVIAHDFADGFNTYTLTSLYGNARRKAVLMLGADAIAPVVGAASTLLFTVPDQVLGIYLGLFSGVLLYLAAADILPEAHHDHPALSTLGCTVAGVGFVWLVVGAAG